MSLKLIILGCGSSVGVPRLGGPDGADWGDCDPQNPKNRRLRCSALLQRRGPDGVTNVVIDTSPDFRAQMLAAKVSRVDAVVYTHPHADHIHGIDDLRQYVILQKHRIPTYADAATLQRLHEGFGYCYETPKGSNYPPVVTAHEIMAGEIVTVDGPGGAIRLLPVLQTHGAIHSLGFRVGGALENLRGGLMYSSDISDVPGSSIAALSNLDCWVVDGLMYRIHYSHFAVSQALEWIARLRPSRAVLTHMHVPLDYEKLRRELPPGVEPAFDGMEIEIEVQDS